MGKNYGIMQPLAKLEFAQEVNTMAKEKRFMKTYSQDMGSTMIMVDKETGINYLFISSLDKEGKPIITPIEDK